MFTWVYFLAFVSMVAGHTMYLGLIPNGRKVPNPCLPGNFLGVGHERIEGGGTLNVFGKAFKDTGLKWTKELCMADSDKDGLTNGQELGDPHCKFVPGGDAPLNVPLGHPGVCEPIEVQACAWQNFTC